MWCGSVCCDTGFDGFGFGFWVVFLVFCLRVGFDLVVVAVSCGLVGFPEFRFSGG